MHSCEDRIRAVEFFIQLGKRVAETIHRLGDPTENALKSRYRACAQDSDLPRGEARAKPQYASSLCVAMEMAIAWMSFHQ